MLTGKGGFCSDCLVCISCADLENQSSATMETVSWQTPCSMTTVMVIVSVSNDTPCSSSTAAVTWTTEVSALIIGGTVTVITPAANEMWLGKGDPSVSEHT